MGSDELAQKLYYCSRTDLLFYCLTQNFFKGAPVVNGQSFFKLVTF